MPKTGPKLRLCGHPLRHGMSGTPFYQSYNSARQRGKRQGVPVWQCPRCVYEAMGERPGPEFELHRVSRWEGYVPKNVIWVAKKPHRKFHRGFVHVLIGRRGSHVLYVRDCDVIAEVAA